MKKDEFAETRIKMVMKLGKLGRRAAVAKIARMDAARKRTGNDGGVDASRALTPHGGEDIPMTAREFFGEA